MPLTAAVGSISLAVDNLRSQLADSAAFRTWMGAVNQAEALARIHYESLPPPADGNEHTLAELSGYRPYALVWTEAESGFTKRTDGYHAANESGVMMIRLVQTVDPAIANDPAEISRRFLNTVGAVFDELIALSWSGGYLAIETVELEFGPYRGDPEERSSQGDYVGADLKVTWRNGE